MKQSQKVVIVIIAILTCLQVANGQNNPIEKIIDWSNDDRPCDLIKTNDNGYVLLLKSISNVCVLKLDSEGDSVWSYCFDSDNSSVRFKMKVIQSSNNDFLIASEYDRDCYLLRLNNDGDSIDSFVYPGIEYFSSFNDVDELDNGDLIIVSKTYSDSWPLQNLYRFKANGELVWKKVYTTDQISNVVITSDSSCLMIKSDIYNTVSQFYDLDGNKTFTYYLGLGQGVEIIESFDGFYYSAHFGETNDTLNCVKKLDGEGNVLWGLFDPTDYNFPLSISSLKPDLLSVCGGINEELIIKFFNPDGDSLSSFIYNNYTSQYARNVCLDGDNIVISAGIIDSLDNRSLLFLKLPLDSVLVNTSSHQLIHDSPFYPNPANDKIFFKEKDKPKEIVIYNINGQKVIVKNNVTNELNTSFLRNGIYALEILQDNRGKKFLLIIN